MNRSQINLPAAHGSKAIAALCLTSFAILAQHPVLAPTANISIVVTTPLHFSAIHIPHGVTVRFVAPLVPGFIPSLPAVIHCDRDIVIRGTVSVAG
jgi:hypothetical protein